MAERERHHRIALVGPSRNYVSSLYLDDAAEATVAALRAPAGIFNVADDDPLELGVYMASMAHAAGARPLMRPPSIAGGAVLGEVRTYLRRSQRVSSARTQEATGWKPTVPNARAGWIQIARAWGSVTKSKG